MKKSFSLITSVLLCSLTLSATGCVDDRIAKLAPEYKGAYTIQVKDISETLGNQNYTFTDSEDIDKTGLVVLSSTKEEKTSYSLFDLTTQSFMSGGKSNTPIYPLDDGLFYSTALNTETGKNSYTLYSRDWKKEMGEGSVSLDGVFKLDSNNVRTFVNVDGNVVEEKDPFKEIFNNKKADKCIPVGKFFISYDSSANLVVYNAKGKKVRTMNPTLKLGLSTESEFFFYEHWKIGNKIFMQVRTLLSDTESSYDVYTNGKKYDLATYSYDVKEDKLATVKDFHYIVKSVEPANASNVLLHIQEIKNKQVVKESYLQAFNSRGQVSIDLQNLVSGAMRYDYDAISDFSYLWDSAGYTHIYEGNKHVRTLDSDYKVYGRHIMTETTDKTTDFKTLTFYDIKDASKSTTISNVKSWSPIEYGNNICYHTKNDEIFVFDTATGKSSKKIALTETQSVTYKGYYLVVNDSETQTSQLVFMDGTTKNLSLPVNKFTTKLYKVDNTEYQIIKYEQDGDFTYKLLIMQSPYEVLS